MRKFILCYLAVLLSIGTAIAQTTSPYARSISAGGSHAALIKANGKLYTWGNNTYGQLGVGDTDTRDTLIQVGTDTTWVKVAASDGHTLAIKSNGTLWAWGRNTYGQLGDNSTTQRTLPVQIGTDTTWVEVYNAKNTFSFAKKANGTLWSWGRNQRGQLGNGDNTGTTVLVPTQINGDTDWLRISAGNDFVIAVKGTDELYGWGLNVLYQLGLGKTTPNLQGPFEPVLIDSLGTNDDWRYVAAGANHTAAVKTDNTIWGWGNNNAGQTGNENPGTGAGYAQQTPDLYVSTFTNHAYATSGTNFSVALRTNGTLWSLGVNSQGQLGLGYTSSSPNYIDTLTQIGSATNWIYIATGDSYTIGLQADGKLYGWGVNTSGQLGIGSTTNQTSPQLITTL